ncbi:BTAD domain-containing putative transcriptional regulator [Umezawaea sp. Da 62-37]|uniref:BTAD domain-containing putative transcriptional regulator n=1 Tax=Umezawaea sp. Da 62-37 TaxID=3075927 RepID=UPI0028F6E389|nr:BTAD domain-containing putative transcriptional regulator [Umezawaea sp. Da 62-37]WNV87319.1 BTAD domain-containing putative transcriptional regulator [Umezawaea sp. Da 62-37]
MVPTAELKVSLLGEPRAWLGDSPLKLGNGLQAAAFVALALRANRVVSRTELITDLWGETRPSGASNRIYTYISALRRILGGGGEGRGTAEVLESGYSGYRLAIASDDLDFALLQRYRDSARVSRAAGDLAGELSSVDSALAMWKGEALSSVPGPLALSWRGRLDEVKLALSARRACLMIDLGHHDEVVGELRELTALYPVREDIHHSLMLALSRSGRPLEALEVYREARDMLVERFGTEPGAALRALRQEVLAGGATKAPSPDGAAVLADHDLAGTVRLRVENARPSAFVGRTAELDRIRSAVAGAMAGRGGSLWINGAPGTGKTALLGEGLADVVGGDCVVGWAVADELSQRIRLGVLDECVGHLDSAYREHVGQQPPDLAAEDAEARADTRLRLGGVIARVRSLLDAAGGRPVVLVVDDLHWADDESLLVWRHLHTMTKRHPLLLVTTCRPLPRRRNLDLLRMLVAESGCDVFDLGELSDTEADELLRGSYSADRPADHAVTTMSAGNPAFVHAIARAAADLPVPNWSVAPAPVVEVVREHLDCLSECTGEMLRRASLLGVSHTVGELLKASGKRAHDLLNFVDEALAGGVLVDLGGSRLRFRHPIVRRVLYESVPAALRRAALHDADVDATTALSTYWSRPIETHPSTHDDAGDRLVQSSGSVPRYRR